MFTTSFLTYTDILVFIECDSWNAPVQRVIGALQMHWIMVMMMKIIYLSGREGRGLCPGVGSVKRSLASFRLSASAQHQLSSSAAVLPPLIYFLSLYLAGNIAAFKTTPPPGYTRAQKIARAGNKARFTFTVCCFFCDTCVVE